MISRWTKVFLSLLSLGLLYHPRGFAKDSLQTGTSVSHFYEARSVFTNPAALAYQTELNGSQVLSSLSWASHPSSSDLAIGLSWGGLGFGLNRQQTLAEPRTRFSLASALALTPWAFFGNRLGINQSTSTTDGFTQWDIGLQLRPSPYFAVGSLVTQITRTPLYSFGLTLQPLSRLLIWADFETSSRNFGNDWNYQGTASYELLRGFFLQGGYDKTEKVHVGFQWDLGKTSLSTLGRTEGSSKTLISHLQFNPNERAHFLSPQKTLELTLDSNLKESPESSGLFAIGKPCFSELLYKIDSSLLRSDVENIFIEIKSFPLGLGSALELHQALWEARKAGKIIHVSLENARLKEYLIASAAHSISLAPSSSIDWSGPKSERYYFKGTLDKVGIEAEIVAKGIYKSAPESLTLKKSSDRSRENIQQNLTEAEIELKKAIQVSGRVTESVWKKASALGLLSTQEALDLKLVDKIQVAENAKNHFSGKSISSSFVENRRDLSLPSEIALIVASGDIVRDKMRFLGFFGGEQITPDQISDLLEKAKNNPRIRAVIFRVSSGGGDVLASHLIANQIEEFSKLKPTIVSMGDVAASGGYFISAPATSIVASPLTLTGSIGVFSGKPNLSALFKKIDLNKEVISRSAYPNLFNEAQKWSEAEREIIKRQVSQYYQTFTGYVASHRSIALEKMDSVAQGRVWFGRKALSLKLIDEVGGISQALKMAQEKAGLKSYSLRVLSAPTGLLDALSEAFFVSEKAQQSLIESEEIYSALKPSLLSDNPFLFWWDQRID